MKCIVIAGNEKAPPKFDRQGKMSCEILSQSKTG
jgi:hypothetical protein